MTAAPIVTRVGAATDTGLRRRLNEDAYLAEAPLFLVADGMGGHDAGERASAAVVAEFARLVGAPSLTVDEVRVSLRSARARVDAIASDGRGAGTTLTGVIVAEVAGVGYWLTVNVGDSRTYRFANGFLEQISVDHSVVQELIDAGELTVGDARGDSRRNEITRAIGAGSDGRPDYWMVPAAPGDRILVCSDGLSGEVGAERLRDILVEEADPQDAATRLVHEALLHGGRDNVTAIVVDALAVSGDHDDVFDTAPAGARRGEPDGDTRPRARSRGDS